MGESVGEFEQLILFAVVRLEADATAVTIREEIETRTTRRISWVHSTRRSIGWRRAASCSRGSASRPPPAAASASGITPSSPPAHGR